VLSSPGILGRELLISAYNIMARYGKKAQQSVEKAMHEYKRGRLNSGRSNKPVKSQKQAVAIGLSEARKKGAKMPPEKAS
jgi:hypothetical protein